MTKIRPERVVVPAETIREGLRAAADMAIGELDVDRAVGESGRLIVEVELRLDSGKPSRVMRSSYFARSVRV